MLIDSLIDDAKQRQRGAQEELLVGIQNLFDAIADQAFDDYGIDALLRPTDNADLHVITKYVTRKSVPNETLRELLQESLQHELQRVQDDPAAMLSVLVQHCDATALRNKILEKLKCPPPVPATPEPSSTDPSSSDASMPSTTPPEPPLPESSPTVE